VRAASAARTVERGKNPEDGTGEGLATFTHLSGTVMGTARATRGTRRRAFEGARTPGEAIPSLRITDGCVSGHRDTGARAAGIRSGSAGEANFRRGSPGTLVAGVRRHEEDPEAVSNGEGGALEATKALLATHHKPL